MKSSLFESQRALSVLAFLCEIRVLGWFVSLCSLSMGFLRSILKVLSYSTSGLSFVQNPLVFLEITFRPMYTISGLPLLSKLHAFPTVNLGTLGKGCESKRMKRV